MTNFMIQYKFPDEISKKFKLETTNDINYPYLIPFEILFNEGKPVGKINYLVLQFEDKFYALGTLNYSRRGRYIFFTGLSDTKVYNSKYKISGEILHLTCEWDLKSFHIKIKDNSKIIPKYPITKINEGHYYWFSLSIKYPEYLKLLKNFEYEFSTPDNDTQRRINEFLKGSENMVHKILTLPEKGTLDNDEFINFNFYISHMDYFDRRNIKIICPFGQPPKNFESKGKIYEVDLKDTDYKIIINVSKIRYRKNLGNDKARIFH